jgi:hypothetical protein
LGLRVRNPDNGSNGCDIGDRRSCLVHIVTGMVRTHTGAPEILIVTVKGMRLGAMPPIGISVGVVIFRVILEMRIGFGLGAQGV